ncbi:MAG TPA: hypothetical protein VKR58_04575 [Aquella sp.]|nr:hypothetical protein [Aquella sp.]
MGMLYEYEGFDNLFESGKIVTIDAEYLGKVKNGHEVRIRWYPEAIDNSNQIKVVGIDSIQGLIKKGSKIKLLVEYVAFHREGYHIIQINSPKSGREDILVHGSLFDITMEPTVPFLQQVINYTKEMNDAAQWVIKKIAS